ncbi:hypothetical protein PV325_009159, partial [Microctonus aethiopoides]
ARSGGGTDSGGSQSSPIRSVISGKNNATDNAIKESDLLAHAASALRRLHFKSAGGSRSCRTVPKVVVRGSSTASETTINTSTESANTMVTMITTTDSEQRDDSLDLIDDTNELSPPLPPPPLPPPSTSMNSSSPTKNGPHNPESLSRNLTTAITQATTASIIHPNPETTLNADKSPVNGIGAPPPTPLIGARHESKFTFSTGRIPALPDIRTADFF